MLELSAVSPERHAGISPGLNSPRPRLGGPLHADLRPTGATIAISIATSISGTVATIACSLALILTAGLAHALEINGQLRLLNEDGSLVEDAADIRRAVVYFEPEAALARPAEPAEYQLSTRRRQFEPRVLVIPVGSNVRFPNDDPILHNVFSASPPNRFDLGLYGRSDGKLHHFDSPGLVRVFCNVHPAMSAHIVVVNSPFFTRPEGDGRFSLDQLPEGPGRLTLWHERASPVSLDLDLDLDQTSSTLTMQPVDLVLDVREIQRQRLPRRRGRY